MPHKVSLRALSPLVAFAGCLGLFSCAPSSPPQLPPKPAAKTPTPYVDGSFWAHWGDGQAEVSSYDLTYPRYGSARSGLAVTIFVAESFSLQSRVKADPGKHSDSDVFSVMKLNLVEDFQTGIYDYNEQTSSFLALAPAGHQQADYLTKASFSSQEWCGHSWAQWTVQPDGLQYTGHSYFDGEADRSALIPTPNGGITEEHLMFWARSMAEPKLMPGEERTVPFRRSLQQERHSHREAKWTKALLTRGVVPVTISVPAGKFAVETWRVEIPEGPEITFSVERASSHRILEWRSSDGERAVLVQSDRMKYWELNKPGGESALRRLGLHERTPRTP